MTATSVSTTDRARAQAREILKDSQQFRNLPPAEQQQFYREVVRSISQQLGNGNGAPVARAMDEAPKKASDLINDDRYLNKRIDQLGAIAQDFVEAVDFPKFVRDLLKGVFDANLEVTLAQMKAYGELLKTATASVAKFVKDIDNTSAFGYLAENQSDNFNLDFDDEGAAVLKDKDGTELAKATDKDIGDNEVKAKIMDAKIAMAKEQRALLRETLLMGVTRLVVERGNVKAGVLFDFKATEHIDKKDKAALKEASSSGTSVSHSTGPIVALISGSLGGGYTSSKQEARISVSSAKGVADTSVAAKLTGSVDITFKSDYFKLDNFAQIYGPVTREGTPPPALPAAPAAAKA